MIDKTQIAQQAKKIMDSFMSALENAGKAEPEFSVKRENNIRDPKTIIASDPDFRDRMFKNAPKVMNDCIVAEKKKW